VAFLTPLSSLLLNSQRLQLARAHLERLMDVLDAAPEQDRRQVQNAPPLMGEIELRQVSFRYDPRGPEVLRDISFTIQPGQKVALVGRTGSGKSTLAMLLLGLYPPTEGEVLYDGIPSGRLDYATLRSQFGVVLQEPAVFSSSIRHNIAFNDPAVPFERVVEAAHLAEIHDEIMALPDKYDSPVAERGQNLSGGQRQRIALARVFLLDPPILILDEATSALDTISERKVQQAIGTASRDRTVIMVAHRLSTFADADRILVFDDGRIAETGTYADLMEKDGLFAELVRASEMSVGESTRSPVPA